MRLPYKFLSLACLTLSAIAAPALPMTADDILAALSHCDDAAVALEASIKIVTSTSPPAVFTTIETNVLILSNCVQYTTTTVQGTLSLTLASATNILGKTHDVGILIKSSFVKLAALKQLYLAYGTSTIISRLTVFRTNVYQLEDALAIISPAAIVPQIHSNQLTIDAVFSTTLAAFL